MAEPPLQREQLCSGFRKWVSETGELTAGWLVLASWVGSLILICVSLASPVTAPLPLLSGLALFLIVFFSLVFSVFAIVIGIILYNKWQEQSRKRFY